MEYLSQVVINGLFLSGLYALPVLGVTLVFGIARIGDLAQGALYAVSGYLVFIGTSHLGLPYGLAAPLAITAVAGLSVTQGRLVYRPLQRLGIGPTFLGAVGLLIVIENALALGFTWEPQALSSPWGTTRVHWGGAVLPPEKLVIVATALLGAIGLWFFLHRTWTGKGLRALAQNRETAELVGVNAAAVSAWAFAVAGLLTGAAGAIMATVWPLTPYAGSLLILKAFAIAIIARGRMRGALLGALLVGLSEALVQGYGPAPWSDLVAFVLLIVVILTRPERLGPEEEAGEKAPQVTARDRSRSVSAWTRALPIGLGALTLALLIALPPDDLWLHLLILMGINVLLVSGLDLLTGYAGIPSLAHAALWGVGAYTSALLALRLDWTFPMALLGALLTTLAAALVIGALGLRLKGRWISFTFLVGVVITLLLSNLSLTGGTGGLVGIPSIELSLPGLGEVTLSPYRDKLVYLYLVLAAGVATLWLKSRIVRSRMGRALVALREDEGLARSVGIPAWRYKMSALLVSAALAAVAGSLYAHYLVYLNPELFAFVQSFNLFVMNLVGGAATLWGPVLGPAALTLFDELTRPVHGGIAEIAFGVALILTLIHLPGGLAAGLRRLWSRLRSDRDPRPMREEPIP